MNNRPAIKKLFLLISLVFIASLAAWLNFLFEPVVQDEQGYKYTVSYGASLTSVTEDLYKKGIISNRLFFNLLTRIHGSNHELKAGQYLFAKGATPSEILDQMTTGTGIIYYSFTIIPGWNFHQLLDALQQETNLNHKLTDLTDTQIMTLLGSPTQLPEGQFMPDTYFFVAGSSDLALLKRSYKAMQVKLDTAWQQRALDLPYKNSYDVLIAASLVEKEAYLKSERPIIAGVLVNRLRSDMLLQFDPTVIYGLGSHYDGVIHRDDLTTDTPYNTYIHKGLPPTPIAMPSYDSILAVTHPDQNNYFYFVARNIGGSHQFSRTLEEHHAAVEAAKAMPWYFNSGLVKRYFVFLQIQSAVAKQ